MDDEVYREEYRMVACELEGLRDKITGYDNDWIL